MYTVVIIITWCNSSDSFLNSESLFYDGDIGLCPIIDFTFGVWPKYECHRCTPIQHEGCSNIRDDDREEVLPEYLGESEKAAQRSQNGDWEDKFKVFLENEKENEMGSGVLGRGIQFKTASDAF